MAKNEIDLTTASDDMKVIEDLLIKYTKKYGRMSLVDNALYSILSDYDGDPAVWEMWLLYPIEEVYTKLISEGFYYNYEYGFDYMREYVNELLFKYSLVSSEEPECDHIYESACPRCGTAE